MDRLLRAFEGVAPDIGARLRWQLEVARSQGKVFLPAPTLRGNLKLGRVLWGDKPVGFFLLDPKDLTQHLGIFGRSGSGKTNCSLLLLDQWARLGFSYLVFDFKRSYRGLPAKVFTPGSEESPFSFNPLDSSLPEHLREGFRRHLLAVLLNTYFRDLKLLSVEGVEYLLLKALADPANASFKDLYRWLLRFKTNSRERDWKASALNVLYKLSTGPLGRVLESGKFSPLNQRTVIELEWLGSPKDMSFLVQAVLLNLYYTVSLSPPGQPFLVVIEEAHNVLLRHSGYETVIELILRQIREYNAG